ncbi:Hcp family type VI secretion system effector [Pseudomonas abietaniphila]|uniref:Hcp family type VI secretion system effector n=1 Tax=Pseudomonas abietaniphila TaxID=89065 RepID=UPI000780384F|nr:Hcp family type VI secretion system effector [Pseudomonas abietaniphila]
MPIPAYLTIIGERQGLISSGANTQDSIGVGWQSGHEDQIMVQAVKHGLSGRMAQSDGNRMHRPLIITKVLDKTTPLLFSAASSGERLTTCRLDWYRPSSTAGLEPFFTMELTDAVILDIDIAMPHCQDIAAAAYTQMERVQLAYRQIMIRHDICGTIITDAWRDD